MESEAEFLRQAREEPAKLIASLPSLEPHHRTYALEALGYAAPSRAVFDALEDHVNEDQKGFVREGAVYGLVTLCDNALARLATLEAALRSVRDGLLEDIVEHDDVMDMVETANEALAASQKGATDAET